MKLSIRELDLPPDPLRLARALADRPGVALLLSADGSGPSFVTSDPIAAASGLDPEPSCPLDPTLGELGRWPRWIGLLPYESRRQSLERALRSPRPDTRPAPHVSEPSWWRYGAVARIADHVVVAGDDAASVRDLARRLSRPPLERPASLWPSAEQEPDARHVERIERALELIARGELYQVNLARRIRLAVEGHPIDLMARLADRARPPFGLALCAAELDVVSTSPELFLDLAADGQLRTSPIKGTRPRGRDADEDRRLGEELDRDPKERAELTMILDVERNDLGRVARTGSVRLIEAPRIAQHPTLFHRGATVGAELRPGVDRTTLLEAMLPSGSVTGAPKVRAMEVIAELEADRRGLYTGALGFQRHDGGLELAMAIRTLTVRGGDGHYHVGGGIVADSDPRREVEETRWKALQLAAAPEARAGA